MSAIPEKVSQTLNPHTTTTNKYIAEFPSIFYVYYNYTSVFSDLFRSILYLHRNFKYVKKLSNEKFLDIRELDENFLTYYRIPRYIEW